RAGACRLRHPGTPDQAVRLHLPGPDSRYQSSAASWLSRCRSDEDGSSASGPTVPSTTGHPVVVSAVATDTALAPSIRAPTVSAVNEWCTAPCGETTSTTRTDPAASIARTRIAHSAVNWSIVRE